MLIAAISLAADEGDGTVTTLTEATLPAKQAVIPNYGIALLTIGAVLIIVILIAAICTVAVGISAMKRTHRNKILPEFL